MVRLKGLESGNAAINRQGAKHILSCDYTTVNEILDSCHMNRTLLDWDLRYALM